MLVSGSAARRRNQAGFGVIEIAVVVSVAAIIITTSLVMFGKARARYELRSKAQSMAWQIERARSLAIMLNRTVTLGFTSQNSVFGITGNDTPEAKEQLPPITLANDLELSVFPTITIKGNGTIEAKATDGRLIQSIVLKDKKGRQLPININNSGRIVVGHMQDAS